MDVKKGKQLSQEDDNLDGFKARRKSFMAVEMIESDVRM